ncbi:MAG: hypothetical protein ABSC93_22935 [Bryobacteraceae bacterium]
MNLLISAGIVGVCGAAFFAVRQLASGRNQKKHLAQVNMLRDRLENPWG